MSEKAERLSVSHITATKTTGASINRLSSSHCPPKEGWHFGDKKAIVGRITLRDMGDKEMELKKENG